MIPFSYNMVDMGGIDLAEANHTVVPGIYEKIIEAINLCGDLILYNWKFADINIVPSAYTVLQQTNSILINGMIQVTELDEITVLGIEPPPPPIEPVEPLVIVENGIYEAEPPISGFNPVTVDVSGSSEPSLPSEYQEVEYITFDGNEFMLVENLSTDYLVDVVASNSVSMNETCVVGYREVSNNDRDFEIRFQSGSLNIWARSNSYTYTVFASNPTGSALNVVRDIMVACVNHVSGKFLIGKYSTQNMDIAFKGNLYAIKVYSVTRTAGALTVMELSRKFIPCYRIADNEIGLYEVYTGVFYANEGTGTLSKGQDVD